MGMVPSYCCGDRRLESTSWNTSGVIIPRALSRSDASAAPAPVALFAFSLVKGPDSSFLRCRFSVRVSQEVRRGLFLSKCGRRWRCSSGANACGDDTRRRDVFSSSLCDCGVVDVARALHGVWISLAVFYAMDLRVGVQPHGSLCRHPLLGSCGQEVLCADEVHPPACTEVSCAGASGMRASSSGGVSVGGRWVWRGGSLAVLAFQLVQWGGG
ncbi:hypothetical protein K438DRAFT_1839231 [Mycena galopus ATCC 62051]|nr:hypothetical protein K438DRAFT_1839231 [Mycena galopus ATCC 62051]